MESKRNLKRPGHRRVHAIPLWGVIQAAFSRKKAVGIIGGADGPTAVFVTKIHNDGKKAKNHRCFLQDAAKQISPCGHDFSEFPDYLKKRYGAVEFPLNERRLKMLKACVIMNHFPHLLKKPEPLGENPSKKEILRYHEQDTSWEQAQNYPAKKLGLDLRAYLLPHEKPEPLEPPHKRRGFFRRKKPVPVPLKDRQEVIVELEMTTEYLTIHNGSRALMNELVLWRGVTQKDIDEQSPRFIGYAHVLKEMGKL